MTYLDVLQRYKTLQIKDGDPEGSSFVQST